MTGHSVCNCFVKDIFSGGACLIVPLPEDVPDYFRLNCGVDELKCRVRWRNGNEMGVEFFLNK